MANGHDDRPSEAPSERWIGGCGGRRDVDDYASRPDREHLGRGFTGNDFATLPPPDERAYATPDHLQPAPDALQEDPGPYWGKGPKGYERSDARTREEVCDAIADQGRIDASDVEVKVEHGVVTLSGTVAMLQDKSGLERIARRCRGVRDVLLDLRLRRAVPAGAAAQLP